MEIGWTVLALLLRERRRVVTKDELMDTVWGDRFVSESTLTSRVKAARRAIGDDGTNQRLIRTVRGRGDQFVGEVTTTGTDSPSAPTRSEQQIRSCTTPDDVRLAYAVSGDGPPLVKAANWLSHLDYDWESPAWRHFLSEVDAFLTTATPGQRRQ